MLRLSSKSHHSKIAVVLLLSLVLPFTTLAEFAVNDKIELVQTMSGRKNPDFYLRTKNVIASIPIKTKLIILEKKHLLSGNWGFRVQVLDGPLAPKEYWVYYSNKNPGMKLYQAEISQQQEIKKVDNADYGQTFKKQDGIDFQLAEQLNRKQENDLTQFNFVNPPAANQGFTILDPSYEIKKDNKKKMDALIAQKKNDDAWDQKITSLYSEIAKAKETSATSGQSITVNDEASTGFTLLASNYWTETSDDKKPFKKRNSADHCSNVDNRSDLLGPVRNQDSVGWCFAYAAADLVSYKLGTKISAFDLGLSYFQTKEGKKTIIKASDKPTDINNPYKTDYAGGAIQNSIATLYKQGGACKEDDLHSDDFKQSSVAFALMKDGSSKVDLEKFYSTIEDKDVRDFIENIEGYKRKNQDGFYNNEKALCETLGNTHLLFPDLDLATILGTIEGAKNSGNAIDWLQYLSCNGKRIPLPDKTNLRAGNVQKEQMLGHMLLPEIDEQLDKGNILQATYQVHMLLQDKDKKDYPGNPEHASTIVARKFSNGSCQYLVRNNWGKSCDYYNPALECENGSIWVTEKDLQKSLTGIVYFPK